MPAVSRHIVVPVLALLWLLGMGATLVAREPVRATLVGQVIARETGRPIPNAIVEARGEDLGWWRQARTDAKGEFRMRGLPVGEAMLQASSKVHRMPKEQPITLQEGARNRVTLVAPPVDPFLELAMPQRVTMPDETPKVICSGYTAGETLRVALRRISWEALRSAREAPATPYDEGLRVPPSVGETVSDEEIPAAPKDPEGALRRRIEIPPLPPGIYSLWVEGKDARAGTVFSVSRIGLITKTTKRDLLAYVVDLATGRPVPDAAVTIFQGPAVATSGRTGADGLFRAAPPGGPGGATRVVAEAADSVAFTRAEPYFYDPDRPFRVYLYTDRPIYRPGQTVHYKGIVRERLPSPLRGGVYRVPAGEPVRVQVRSPSGALLQRVTATTTDYGSFHGEIPLAPDAAIGQYLVETALGGGIASADPGAGGSVSQESFPFTVAEYRKPEYLVEVTTARVDATAADAPRPAAGDPPARGQYIRGDRVAVTVTARYVWGAPVKAADVTYRVTRRPYWMPWEEDEFAGHYALDGDYGESGEPVLTGKARTDAQGVLRFAFETRASSPRRSPASGPWRRGINPPRGGEGERASEEPFDNQDYLYVIEAEVTDAGRMPVTGTGRSVVSRAAFRLQVEPGRWIAPPGEAFPLRVRAVDWEGTPRPGVAVTLTVGKQKAHATTGPDGLISRSVPAARPGGLQVTASAVDERGNRTEESAWLWVASGEEGFSDPDFDYAELELVADRKRYEPGDTATVMIQTSQPGDTALLTVEGRELYSARVVPLASRSTPIQVPLTRAYQPNVYLSVTTIRGKTIRTRELRLQVSPAEHGLQVEVTADRERYGPRQEAVYQIRTRDAAGRPVAAEASLGLVDESIYAIMPDSPIGGLQAFYGQQENRVSTAFSFPEIYLASDKEDGPREVRRDFPDTASWFPAIRTGPDGRATLRVRLPDTLTTWRATVRAHTLATQVGSGIHKVISTKPLLVRLETPRFFAQNDETLLSAVVHNDTDRPERVTVTLKAAPLTLRDAATAELSVPARGFARRDWRAGVGAGRSATLLVSARAASGLNDAVELTRPIVAHGTEERDSAAGEIAADRASFRLTLPAGALRETIECRVTLNGSPVGVMLQALDYLNARDDATSENAVGWFLPHMTVAMALRELGILPTPPAPLPSQGGGAGGGRPDPLARLAAELPQRVADSLARLYRMQSYDGGWGWGAGTESDAFWTAYALYGLDQARRAGYLVDPDVLERGAFALREWWAKVPDESNRALCLYVLQRAETPPSAATRQALLRMATRAPKLQNYPRALIALSLADLGETDVARRVAQTLHGGCQETGDETWWPEIFPWGFYSCNDNETTGYALMALIRLDPGHPRIERAARWLMRRREGDGWTSTEDTASVIYALAAYMQHVARARPPDCTITTRVNGQAAGRQRITRETMFAPLALAIDPALLREGENEILLEKEGEGAPLYSAFLRAHVGGEALPAASSGLTVRRAYFRRTQERDIHGRWRERDRPVNGSLRAGEEVVVKLDVHAAGACREIVIRDPLPAGCEGLDPLSDRPEDAWHYGDQRREVRDRDVTFYAGFLRPGRNRFEYRFRAQIPGDYHVMPAQAAAAYIPEIWGRSAEARVRIRE